MSNDFTILDRLALHAQHDPGRLAFRFLKDNGPPVCLSYGQLYSRVGIIAASLREHSAAGDRALLYPPGREFIEAFLGCLAAGIIAVPAYPPRRNRSADRLLSVVRDCSPRLFLTTRAVSPAIGPDLLGAAGGVKCLSTDAIDTPPSAWPAADVHPGGVAFLQYTSGSTGTPRGVVITHRNIVSNEAIIQTSLCHTAETIMASWLPLFHDMGLIGCVLQPLYVGFPCVLLAPADFVQKPIRWLQAITQYRATTAGGPNFAWEHCVKRVSEEQKEGLDLSSLTVAFNGAEPIRAETLDRFTAAFSRCGFRLRAFFPCYGLAEATLFVSGGPPQREPIRARVSGRGLEEHAWVPAEEPSPEGRWLVSSGQVAEGMRVEVVNPETRCRCPANEIGEIWVASDSVATGYWGKPNQTQELLRAGLSDGDGTFLRTGDLGYVAGGELFITDRLKDLIIIGGRNIYPQDVEEVAERALAFAEVNACAAFATLVDGEERLAIVAEATRDMVRLSAEKKDQETSEGEKALGEMVARVLEEVAAEFEVAVQAIVFVRPGTFPRTSSGKVQRRACRDGLLGGSLDIVHKWQAEPVHLTQSSQTQAGPPRTWSGREGELASWLQQQLQEVLGLADPPATDRSFFDFGMDSLKAVELLGRLQKYVGQEHSLPHTLAFDHPTVSRLTTHLASRLSGPPRTPPPARAQGRSQRGSSRRKDLSTLSAGQLARLLEAELDKLKGEGER